MFRFGVVCGGSSLTAAQPYNNIVRVGIENMAAVFGGAQSIFTCAYDEAYQIPTEFSAETALRTQQVVAYESGISKTVDPLGGSYYVEYLTDQMDHEITKVIGEIETYGGAEKAIEDGYLQSRIARRALERKLQTDAGERVVVGQNYFRREDEGASDFGEVFKLDAKAAGQTIDRFNEVRAARDGAAVAESLHRLSEAALRDDDNLIPYMIDCAHAYVSIGEMVGALKNHWGEFQEPVGL